MTCTPCELVLGVDTHRELHAAALIDQVGRLVAAESFAATKSGMRALLKWAEQHGQIRRAGVEGTSSYGARLTRMLRAEGIEVIEISRPKREGARHAGKTDLRDAEAAARNVLWGKATATPKTKDGIVESIRVLHNTRAGAVKARTQTILTLQQLILTGPDQIAEQLHGLTNKQRVDHCARMRPSQQPDPLSVTRTALRCLARRHRVLDDEIAQLDRQLAALIGQAAPRLITRQGVGPQSAAKLLILAGDNPQRLRSDAALAALCGASPIEASSGKTKRHRLNRGGDRQANNALWTIANYRMIHDPQTRAYTARRTEQGKSRKEIRRCLMRHIARQLYPLLTADLQHAKTINFLT